MVEIAQFTAPAQWQAIELVSDLHLCEATPRTFEAFAAYLAGTDADAVFILGDLFEVWVGDDQCTRPFERTITETLKASAAHRWMGFLHGNRDFLAGPAFAQAAGLHLLADPTCLCAFGQRWLLTHGGLFASAIRGAVVYCQRHPNPKPRPQVRHPGSTTMGRCGPGCRDCLAHPSPCAHHDSRPYASAWGRTLGSGALSQRAERLGPGPRPLQG
jgi:hypothetical protein